MARSSAATTGPVVCPSVTGRGRHRLQGPAHWNSARGPPLRASRIGFGPRFGSSGRGGASRRAYAYGRRATPVLGPAYRLSWVLLQQRQREPPPLPLSHPLDVSVAARPLCPRCAQFDSIASRVWPASRRRCSTRLLVYQGMTELDHDRLGLRLLALCRCWASAVSIIYCSSTSNTTGTDVYVHPQALGPHAPLGRCLSCALPFPRCSSL